MIKVVGDIMLDRWISGSVDRISPEAPVPVLLEEDSIFSLGGAANVAINIGEMCDDTTLYGLLGDDSEGDKAQNLLAEAGVRGEILRGHIQTTTKTRLVGVTGQQIMRWDRESLSDTAFPQSILNIQESDLVVISDYAKGSIGENTVREILGKTSKVMVDSKNPPSFYENAFLVKPNMKEFRDWGSDFETAHQLMREKGWKWLVITDGPNGTHLLKDDGEYHHFKEEAKEVADVTGAGDIVISLLAYGYNSGMNIPDACRMANHFATKSVEHRMVSKVSKEDVQSWMS